jgi:hypothetical protein
MKKISNAVILAGSTRGSIKKAGFPITTSGMTTILISAFILVPALFMRCTAEDVAENSISKNAFVIYADRGDQRNHFAPSGWMGDYGDIRIDDSWSQNPASGKTCVRIIYTAKGSQGANWAGLYWQNPPNNWGDRPGGYDLGSMKRLVFMAHGEKGGEKIAEFKIGGISGEHGDSDSASIGPVTLTQNWQKYTIDLAGKDLSHIVGGFAWSASRDDNPNGFTIYLDDMRFE